MEVNIKEILKSIGISLLAVIAIILIIVVISYNKVSLSRVIPKVEGYELTDEIKKEVESENAEQTEILTTYILDASELKHYERTKEYNKGKKHPFAVDTTNSTTDKNNSEDTGNNDSSSGNFYDDDGTK